MVKYDLRQKKYSVNEFVPREGRVLLLRIIFTTAMIAGTFRFTSWLAMTIGISSGNAIDPFAGIIDLFNAVLPASYFFYLVAYMLIYMGIKCLMTIIMCSDKKQCVAVKMLNIKPILVCASREAFTVRQILFIYLVPIIMTYVPLFVLTVLSAGSTVYIFTLFSFSFFWCLDLVLVLYVLYAKLKFRMNYISVDRHVYQLTMFTN
jgi:hypothetical protein